MSDYEKQLHEWKLKQGWTPPVEEGSPEGIQLQVAADRKRNGSDYCLLCGKGPQPIREMRLITNAEDPYFQFDEANQKARACVECFKERYGHE